MYKNEGVKLNFEELIQMEVVNMKSFDQKFKNEEEIFLLTAFSQQIYITKSMSAGLLLFLRSLENSFSQIFVEYFK